MPEHNDTGDVMADITDDPNPEEVQPDSDSFVKPWRPPQSDQDQDNEENA